MKKNIIKRICNRVNLKRVLPLCFLLALLLMTACEQEVEVKKNFPFEFEIMPVPGAIAKGESVEIRCRIVTKGNYVNNKYVIRYFQFEGKGSLKMRQAKTDTYFTPNDLFKIQDKQFQLYYKSLSTSNHSFTIWITDSFENEKEVTFEFKDKGEKKKD